MGQDRFFWAKRLCGLAFLLFLFCHCSSSSSESDVSESDDSPTLEVAPTAVAQLFANLEVNNSLIKAALAESGVNVCNGLTLPDGVETRTYGDAATYGASSYSITVATTDYCTDSGNNSNTGTGPDGNGLFIAFYVEFMTSHCTDDDGVPTNPLYLVQSSGILRNTSDHFPEIYGTFYLDNAPINCTIKLNVDGTMDESHCTDQEGAAIDSVASSFTCETTPQIVAPEVTEYKGIWGPIYGDQRSTYDPDVLDILGATFYTIIQNADITEDGEIVLEYSEETLVEEILDKYVAGIGVMIALDSQYIVDGEATGPVVPEEVITDTDFLNNLNTVVIDLAEFAEDYDVFLFAPYNEADLKLDSEGNYSSDWGQDIIDEIRAIYSGKVLWKAGLEPTDIDFTGYDIAGTSLGRNRGETATIFRNRVTETIDTLVYQADQADVPETMISEFGVWGEADLYLTASEVAEAYQIVFEQGANEVNGFIAFDGPDGELPLYDGDDFANDGDQFDIVRDWFESL